MPLFGNLMAGVAEPCQFNFRMWPQQFNSSRRRERNAEESQRAARKKKKRKKDFDNYQEEFNEPNLKLPIESEESRRI